MKFILSALTLLAQIGIAHPDIQNGDIRRRSKIEQHIWDPDIEYLKSKHSLLDLPSSQKPRFQKRDAQNLPSSDSDKPFYSPKDFLPPPWSPLSNIESPYPPSGVTPWDDSGRAQMLDNDPGAQMWRKCPQWVLDCRKCPRDSRCRRPGFPWWHPTDVLDLPDALTGPQLAGPNPFGTGTGTCPIRTCNDAVLLSSCGENARCIRGHCVCDLGFKGAPSFGPVIRGIDDLQALTVWVDPGTACNVPCDSLSCVEVEQVEACFNDAPTTKGDDDRHWIPWEEEHWGNQEPEMANVSGGAIQVPGAVVEEGADYVDGVATPGTYGEDN